MRKKRKKLSAVFLLFLFLNIHLPSFLPVHAVLAESSSEGAGIQLTLGTIDIVVEKNNECDSVKDVLKVSKEHSAIEMKENIKNVGTLTGKIAYRINLSKDGKKVDAASVNLKLNGQEVSASNEYQLLTESSGEPLCLFPNESKALSLEVENSLMTSQDELINLQVDILMMQTNGTITEPLFHEEVSKNYMIKFNSEEGYSSSEGIQEKTKVLTSEETSKNQLEEIDKQHNLFENTSIEKDNLNLENYPSDEEIAYFEVVLKDETRELGLTQTQFDWISQFESLDAFAGQITEETPPLYIKYDKVMGIEDIEQFVYDLAEQKELGFEIKLRKISEEELLEITFTK